MINQAALESVRERIDRARRRVGSEKDPPVEIVAVTKSFPGEHIVSAHESGLFTIGENRVQEAEKKFKELPELAGMKCRLIGHLQSNKARTAMEIFDAIDSVDSLKLAKRLSRMVIEKGESFPVLAQVNTAADPAKSGFDLNDIELLLELSDLPGLLVEGLMTIGELTRDESHIRKTFAKLRELRGDLNRQLPPDRKMKTLSMGMTSDFEVAVEEGATMIRIGRALFGERPG